MGRISGKASGHTASKRLWLDRRWGVAAAFLAVGTLWLFYNAPNEAPLPSDQRPFGLPLHGPVQSAASDFRSWCFYRFTLPSLITLANKEYSHSAVVSHFEKLELDPAKLKLAEDSRIRVYYIGEGSGYIDSLGINLHGLGVEEGDPRLLFPNANATMPLDAAAARMAQWRHRLFRAKMNERRPEAPLIPGDFVDLGMLPAGTQLNFFMVANDGAGLNTYSVSKERNPDGLAHMVAMAVENTPYLLVSFEDMFQGGDADYEDCVFAVEMSENNVAALIGRLDPWRRIKQLIFWGVVLALLIGTPLGVWTARQIMRLRRLARAHESAKDALRQLRPKEALAIIRANKPHAGAEMQLALSRLEVSALEMTREVAELTELHETATEVFHDHENASLTVGRAYVEEDRFEAFDQVRADWRDRETQPGAWAMLEAESLTRQNKETAACALLEGCAFQAVQEAERLTQLALIQASAQPQAAHQLITRATELAPRHPAVLRGQGLLLEQQGRAEDARQVLETACGADPGNPFLRDTLAEFFRRQGRYEDALAIWAGTLTPPTVDFIWSKALFWSRVTVALPVDIPLKAIPPGPLRPLIEFMIRLPMERFWDAAGFESAAYERVGLHGRQEVFWLRLLQALHTGHETEALSLLNLSGFGGRSWQLPLERALLCVLTYRRSGYLGAGPVVSSTESASVFFTMMNQAVQQGMDMVPLWFAELITGPNAFAAACGAAGWTRAAARLLRSGTWPPGTPDTIRSLGLSSPPNR